MKNIFFAIPIISMLAACVSIESDPVVYAAKAKHIEKHYDAPFDELQVCLSENSFPTRYEGYVLRDHAFYGIKGVLEVWLYEAGGDSTKAHVSGKPGHFDTRPEKWIGILDKCNLELGV